MLILTASVSNRMLVRVLAGVEALGGQLVTEGVGQFELLAVLARQFVLHRVEVQTTCNSNSNSHANSDHVHIVLITQIYSLSMKLSCALSFSASTWRIRVAVLFRIIALKLSVRVSADIPHTLQKRGCLNNTLNPLLYYSRRA